MASMTYEIRKDKAGGFTISRGTASLHFRTARAAQTRLARLVKECMAHGHVCRFKNYDSDGKLRGVFHYGTDGVRVDEKLPSRSPKRKTTAKKASAPKRKTTSKRRTTAKPAAKRKTTAKKASAPKRGAHKVTSAQKKARAAGRKRYLAFVKKAKADGMTDAQVKKAWAEKKASKAPTAKKASAKKAPAKRKAPTAKKASAKKAPAKKASAKRKTSSKKAPNPGLARFHAFVKKAKAAGKTHKQAMAAWKAQEKASGKPATKRTSAKKASAKKAPAKRTSAKRTSAKAKPAAKRTSAKKAPAKRKPAAKKSAKVKSTSKAKTTKAKGKIGGVSLLPTPAQAAAAARRK